MNSLEVAEVTAAVGLQLISLVQDASGSCSSGDDLNVFSMEKCHEK